MKQEHGVVLALILRRFRVRQRRYVMRNKFGFLGGTHRERSAGQAVE